MIESGVDPLLRKESGPGKHAAPGPPAVPWLLPAPPTRPPLPAMGPHRAQVPTCDQALAGVPSGQGMEEEGARNQGSPVLSSSCGARGGFLPRHDEDLREPLLAY